MIYVYYTFLAIPALTWFGCVVGLVGAINRKRTGKLEGEEDTTIIGCTLFGFLSVVVFFIDIRTSSKLKV